MPSTRQTRSRLQAARERAGQEAAKIDPWALSERAENASIPRLVSVLGACAAGMATLLWPPLGDAASLFLFLAFAVPGGGAAGMLLGRALDARDRAPNDNPRVAIGDRLPSITSELEPPVSPVAFRVSVPAQPGAVGATVAAPQEKRGTP